jgi:quercetin dioxygenase-like cupin family protein
VSHFFSRGDFEPVEIAPGVRARVLARGSLMFSLIEIDEAAESSLHHHPEEQMGLVLEGAFERHQGGEVRVLREGDGFYVPPDVVHGGRAIEGPVRILDVFTPPRDVSVRVDVEENARRG